MRKLLLIPACLWAVSGALSGAAQTTGERRRTTVTCVRVRGASAWAPARPHRCALRRRAAGYESLREVRHALRLELHSPQYLHRRGPRYSRAKESSPKSASASSGLSSTAPNRSYGQRMLHGAQMAVDEWNARGGYGGKPFKLMLHNDYNNWQAKAVYGDDRATDPGIWGSAADEAVKMIYDDEDWAIFGSLSSESTHIILRVALKAEIPIVNSESTDFTIPETYVPWYFTDIQDDRVQAFTLARRIYTELGLKRVAILRVNNRYGRFGVPKFRDASRRLGHPVVIEQKFMAGDTDFSHQLQVIRDSRADAIVLWADEDQAAMILKQIARRWHEAARFRFAPHPGTHAARRSRRCGGRIRGRLSVRSHAQRPSLAQIQPATTRRATTSSPTIIPRSPTTQ